MFLSPLIVLSALAFASQALPTVENAKAQHELTSATFSDSIKHGVWYIEFIAPFCNHCNKLRPTWEQLLAYDDAQRNPGVFLAQVDCSAHWGLCQQQRIYGYPTLLTYEDGVKTSRFKPDHERLTRFIDAQTKALRRPPTPIYLPNPDGRVISLDIQSFQPTIDAGPTFVIFAPWCHHCENTWFGTVWAQFALEMKGKATVAELNCLEQKEICRKMQKIKYYPSIFLYIHGQIKEFSGRRRNLEALKNFADAALAPYIPSPRVSHSELATIYGKLAEPIRVDAASEKSQAPPEIQQALSLRPIPEIQVFSIQTSSEIADDLTIIIEI